jgi:hypothetical protein
MLFCLSCCACSFCLPYGVSPNHPTPVDTVYVVDMGMSQQIRSHGERLSR